MVVVEVMLRKAAKDTGSEREETGGVLEQIGREEGDRSPVAEPRRATVA